VQAWNWDSLHHLISSHTCWPTLHFPTKIPTPIWNNQQTNPNNHQNHKETETKTEAEREREKNLKTNYGRSFTQQGIQNPLVSDKPIGPVITFTWILILIIVNVKTFIDRCKNVKRCTSYTRLLPMISHWHWWWYCITPYSWYPSWSPFPSHFLSLSNLSCIQISKQIIKFWCTTTERNKKRWQVGWWQGRRGG
jgi:hypothetical protein